MADDGLRRELGQLVRELLDESHREANPISAAIRAHLGEGIDELPVHGEELPAFELANLQLALDAALARPGYGARVIGVSGQGRRFSDVTLADLVSTVHLAVGTPEYVNEPVGPKRTLPCLVWAVLLVSGPDGPMCVFVRRGEEHGPSPGLTVQALAHDPDVAQRFLADLRALMDELDVFRGQVITIEVDRRGGRRVVFLERPVMDESEATLGAAETGRERVEPADVDAALEELLDETASLTRVLLGSAPPGETAVPEPHAWMQGMTRPSVRVERLD